MIQSFFILMEFCPVHFILKLKLKSYFETPLIVTETPAINTNPHTHPEITYPAQCV